jgi:hypothetical protein
MVAAAAFMLARGGDMLDGFDDDAAPRRDDWYEILMINRLKKTQPPASSAAADPYSGSSLLPMLVSGLVLILVGMVAVAAFSWHPSDLDWCQSFSRASSSQWSRSQSGHSDRKGEWSAFAVIERWQRLCHLVGVPGALFWFAPLQRHRTRDPSCKARISAVLECLCRAAVELAGSAPGTFSLEKHLIL